MRKVISPEQAEINRREWENPDNWGGPYGTAVYFSRKDSRVWVPHRRPGFGKTLNLAHTAGILWMVALCFFVLVVLMVLAWRLVPWIEWVLQWLLYQPPQP